MTSILGFTGYPKASEATTQLCSCSFTLRAQTMHKGWRQQCAGKTLIFGHQHLNFRECSCVTKYSSFDFFPQSFKTIKTLLCWWYEKKCRLAPVHVLASSFLTFGLKAEFLLQVYILTTQIKANWRTRRHLFYFVLFNFVFVFFSFQAFYMERISAQVSGSGLCGRRIFELLEASNQARIGVGLWGRRCRSTERFP